MAPRSRTGCLTCRQRKLKCGEERPVCAQCHKASRECIPSSGITFRHQQNPSMNGDPVSRASLKSFYGYKETFGRGSVWVPIPNELTFVHTNNPYEDEEGGTPAFGGDGDAGPGVQDGAGEGSGYQYAGVTDWSQWQRQEVPQDSVNHDGNDVGKEDREIAAQLAQATYQPYATHGLEALSAVASQDQYNYAPPPAPMASQDPPSSQPAVSPPQQRHANPSEDFTRRGSPSNIDPRLHSADQTPQQEPPTHTPPQSHDPSSHSQPPALPPLQSPSQVRTQPCPPARLPNLSLHSKGTRARAATIRNAELAFLMRDYSERAGAWMDLFDLGRFFSTKVPVLAARCPLLLYSCAALSAKSLARVDGRKPVMNGQAALTRQSAMESWPGVLLDAQGWVRKARENYDLAVSLLRQALSGASRPATSALPLDVTPETIETSQGAPLPTTDSDELIAATAVLCVYEFLDASGPEWSSHLDGAKSLFEVAEDRMMPLTLPPSPVTLAEQINQRVTGHPPDTGRRKTPSRGRMAVFWNFARQDMLSAFINNTSTRLDTADLAMWKSAGLKLTPEGFIYPSDPDHADYVAEHAMEDDTISNALIWLLMKLVNFISAGDDMPHSHGLGVRQQDLLEYWNDLDEQFHVWHNGLPESFHPTAVCPSSEGLPGVEEHWFAQSMCASAMQSYHFARIQLLHNKPHTTTASNIRVRAGSVDPTARMGTPGSGLAARHASYASILAQSRFHAKAIVAISLGRADEGTRVHAVQPLWTAGLVLGAEVGDGEGGEVSMWRRLVVGLLKGIERDMGWASGYRVENLCEGWGVERDWGMFDGE